MEIRSISIYCRGTLIQGIKFHWDTLKLFYNLFRGGFTLLLYTKRGANMHVFVNMVIIGLVLYNTFYLFMPARLFVSLFFPYIVVLFLITYVSLRADFSSYSISRLLFWVSFEFSYKSNWG